MQSRAKEMMEKQLGKALAVQVDAGHEIRNLEKRIASVKDGMEAWLGFYFESSSELTEEFSAFSREYREWVKKNLPIGAKLIEWHRGHFYCYGFIERAGRFVYFSFSDVRFFPGEWHDDILIRTANGTKDYVGGANRSVALPFFMQSVDDLLKVTA